VSDLSGQLDFGRCGFEAFGAASPARLLGLPCGRFWQRSAHVLAAGEVKCSTHLESFVAIQVTMDNVDVTSSDHGVNFGFGTFDTPYNSNNDVGWVLRQLLQERKLRYSQYICRRL
jgi:hypothetical protein